MHKRIYLFFVSITVALLATAQSPGGYGTGLKLWIKADAAATIGSTGGLVDSWTYANNNGQIFTASGTDRPALTASRLNFLPAATFSGAQFMEGPNGSNTGAPLAAGNPDYCLFAVWRSSLTPDNSTTYQRVWSERHLGGANDGNGFALATWNDGTYGDQIELNPYNQAMFLSYTVNKWNISQLNVLDQSVFTSNDLEGRDQNSVNGNAFAASSGGTRTLSDATNRLGARDYNTNESLQGDIAEVIIYDDPITSATVRNQVFSYLALKYGISKAGNYIASDGSTTYWDSTANTGYDNDVFGIGLDNNSGLSVSQSNSMNTGSGDGTGQSGLGNLVLSSPSSLSTDLNFLVIGHNTAALSEISSNMSALAAGSQRLARQWKVQHTGNVGTVNLDIDLTGITTTGDPSTPTNFRLMIDPDGDGDFTNDIDFTSSEALYIKPSSFTGRVAHFTGVPLANGVVFTLITSAAASLPVTWKSFTARVLGNDVVLNWEVDNNAQAKTYNVEHSTNGLDFAQIGSVANNAQVQKYSFTHSNVAGGKHYYRIYQVDADGKAVYSKVADVTIKQAVMNIRLLSNPVSSNYAGVEINAAAAANASIELLSLSGVRLNIQQQGISAGTNTLRVPLGNIASGNYLLKVTVNDMVQLLQVTKL